MAASECVSAMHDAQLLVAQAADPPGVLVLVGQVDAEAALGGVGELVPVVVQRRVDVDGDAHVAAAGPTPDYPHGACATSPHACPTRPATTVRRAARRGWTSTGASTSAGLRSTGGGSTSSTWAPGPPRRLHPRPVGLVAELARAAAGLRPRAPRHRLRPAGLRRVRDARARRSRSAATGASVDGRCSTSSASGTRRGRRQLDGRLHRRSSWRSASPSASSGSCS